VLDFARADILARAVSASSQAVIEALRKVYDAGKLAGELLGKTANGRQSIQENLKP
jgi:ribosomal protein S19E (S16A)